MHLALADGTDPEFAPEPFAAAARQRAHADMEAHARATLELLKARHDALPEAVRKQAERVLDSQSQLLDRLDTIRAVSEAGLRTRIHGDYHLGQVLRTEEDFVILDFEGEPARTLAERRAKQSPLRDVAGMVRSFSYAAYAGLFAFTLTPDDYALLEPWADTWQHWVSRAFVASYRATVGASAIVPASPAFERLLDVFIVEKALYELGYELNNRPDWVRIPLTALLKTL
jgi:trehalose synthase-fused probable maltokinase